MHTYCGTPATMAPEIVRQEPYSEKADVFSFAIILWEILTREEPYPGANGLGLAYAVATAGLRPPIPTYCPVEWADLIVRCWADDPDARPDFDEVQRQLATIATTLDAAGRGEGGMLGSGVGVLPGKLHGKGRVMVAPLSPAAPAVGGDSDTGAGVGVLEPEGDATAAAPGARDALDGALNGDDRDAPATYDGDDDGAASVWKGAPRPSGSIRPSRSPGHAATPGSGVDGHEVPAGKAGKRHLSIAIVPPSDSDREVHVSLPHGAVEDGTGTVVVHAPGLLGDG